MSLADELIQRALSSQGVKPFGMTFPALSRKWLDTASADVSGRVTYHAADLQLESTANWLAPFGGLVHAIGDAADYPLPVSLVDTAGAPVTAAGALLELLPQAYVKLRRLYANLLESPTPHNPGRERGESLRPVPRYLYFRGAATIPDGGGQVLAGESLGLSGRMTVFDEQGLPLDPLALTSCLRALVGLHPALLTDGAAPDQLTSLDGLEAGGAPKIRLIDHTLSPHPGTSFLVNLEVAGGHADRGILRAMAYTGTEAGVLREINRGEGTALIAASPYGRLGARVTLPAIPAGVTLAHDFFTLQVVDPAVFLAGTPDPTFNGSKLEPRPVVRVDEGITLFSTGNALLGGVAQVLGGGPEDALLVAESIADDFPLPADPATSRWPEFPAPPAGLVPDAADSIPTGLREEWTTHAESVFLNGTTPQPVDVLLTLRGLPLGAAVRVYNRRLGVDFTEERGDGAGGVVVNEDPPADGRTYHGSLQLRLTDPLGLVTDLGITAPVSPRLNLDIVLVLRNGTGRTFGNVVVPVASPAIDDPQVPVANGLLDTPRRGIAHAGLHGLDTDDVTLPLNPDAEDWLAAALQQLGEDHPLGRDAPRSPLMVRRDLIAAALMADNWRAALSGGLLSGDLHSADSRRGSPGGPGGRELQATGLSTANGRLAYDLARHALRRTESLYTRLPLLVEDAWNEPAAPAAGSGPFAGVILQTVGPRSETPELALLRRVVDGDIDAIPADFDALVDWLETRIDDIDAGALPGALGTGMNRLKEEVIDWLREQKDGDLLSESQQERVYGELIRELSAACYGRRDSLWALEAAIGRARNFIYLETPALGPLRYGADGGAYSRDLFDLIRQRMEVMPALRLIVCVPKQPFYAPGYQLFQRREIYERFRLFAPAAAAAGGLTSPVLDPARTVVFHPLGFPGRAADLATQTVVVDDAWLLSGSTTMRRRGMTFDGGTDLALTGYERVGGRSVAVRDHRIALMSQRLGLSPSNKTTLANANFARVADGHGAFDLVREMLRAGGYGFIERLYDGVEAHRAYVEPDLDPAIWNPEGQDFQPALAALAVWLAAAGTGGGTVFHDV